MNDTTLNFLELGVCLGWGLFFGLACYYLAKTAAHISYITHADGRQETRQLPLLLRLVLPLAPNMSHLFKRPNTHRLREDTRRLIVTAGYETVVKPEDFLAVRLLFPITWAFIWIPLVHLCLSAAPGKISETMSQHMITFDVLGVLWALYYPGGWLNREIAVRHHKIQRALPFTLDLLTLSVEAGMDFMTALQRNVERGGMNPLNEEILRVVREIQVGRTRKEALQDMADRINHPDTNTVLNSLVQADELGVSIGSILRIQANTIRNKRFELAEKKANEAPVKMLFPLVAFIFPSVFLMLLGPFLGPMIEPVLVSIFRG
jgi:tight adherence protein C